jgi:hypothetical protein
MRHERVSGVLARVVYSLTSRSVFWRVIYHAPENISGTNLSRRPLHDRDRRRVRMTVTCNDGVSENHLPLILHGSSLITLETC